MTIKEEFDNFISNKKVIIVIASGSTEKYENGSYIDSFDVVVRVGNGYIVDGLESKVGSRVDVVHHQLRTKGCSTPPPPYRDEFVNSVRAPSIKRLAKAGCKFLLGYAEQWDGEKREHVYWKLLREINTDPKCNIKMLPTICKHKAKQGKIGYINGRPWRFTQDSSPLAGMLASLDLATRNAREITIYGADFFKTGHTKNYDRKKRETSHMRSGTDGFHNLKANKSAMRRFILMDDRIKIDPITRDALLEGARDKIKEVIIDRTVSPK